DVEFSSALPVLDNFSVNLALVILVLLMIIYLRGVKSTAKIFIWPTYIFIVSIIIMIIVVIYQYNHNSLNTFTYTQNQLDHMQASMCV
ncbi:APC family permease, partial [Francisella tularensis subsp. holarctica]|nr:APC family permease [Francisella tularensis subsp. holarctica]